MNLVVLFKTDFVDEKNTVRLTARRLRHIRNTHQAKPGDTLQVGLKDGKIGTGKVSAINAEEVILKVRLLNNPPPPLPVTILLAMPRPKALKRILTSISSLGVKKIFLINAFRVEKSYWQTPALREETIEHQLILGLEQAKDTIMPQVFQKRLFKPFVEDELPSLARNSHTLLAHPPSKNLKRRVSKTSTLAGEF